MKINTCFLLVKNTTKFLKTGILLMATLFDPLFACMNVCVCVFFLNPLNLLKLFGIYHVSKQETILYCVESNPRYVCLCISFTFLCSSPSFSVCLSVCLSVCVRFLELTKSY
jgi:hypothetical protein